MTWWSATSVNVVAGSNLVTVVTGDAIANISPTDGLIVGNNTPVEVESAYFNGSNNIIKLKRNWSGGTLSAQPAFAFPTDADLGEIAKALSTYLENFTLATQTDANSGTENTRPMTALRVKQAMDFHLGSAATLDVTASRLGGGTVTKVGDFGLGANSVAVTSLDEHLNTAFVREENPSSGYAYTTTLSMNSGDGQQQLTISRDGSGMKFRGRIVPEGVVHPDYPWTPWKEVLKVGDFGIGASGNNNVYSGDILTLSATQLVNGGPATTGGPAGVPLDGAKIWHLKWADPNSATQVVYTYSGAAYERNITGGSPLPWRTVYTSANALGAVAFSDGVNTGAIIERGSNANGDYVKLADGTVIAWGHVIASGVSINPAGRSNSVTGYFCDPVMPVTIIDRVFTLGQHILYASGGIALYTTIVASSAGLPMIMNLGTSTSDAWPRLDEIGSHVATVVEYRWSAKGRWR